jgi:hypothetical protein
MNILFVIVLFLFFSPPFDFPSTSNGQTGSNKYMQNFGEGNLFESPFFKEEV